jgi:hypothetical protein
LAFSLISFDSGVFGLLKMHPPTAGLSTAPKAERDDDHEVSLV